MALGPKVLSLVAVLTGAGIGLPLYFLNKDNSTAAAEQKPLSSSPKIADSPVQVTNPVDKSVCQASTPHTNLASFFEKQHKSSSSYSYVSCKNTVQKISNPLLKNSWEGLFPKGALDEVFSPNEGEQFEMIVEEKSEERNLESVFLIIFKNSSNSSFIQSKYKEFTDNGNKKEITVLMEKNRHQPKEIYLFIPIDNLEDS